MNEKRLKKVWIILTLLVLAIIVLFIYYQNTRVTVVEMKDVTVTLWQTEDGFYEKGYIISEGIYEDRREVVIREKESFTMTILTYDLDGNLVDAEVYTPSTESDEDTGDMK